MNVLKNAQHETQAGEDIGLDMHRLMRRLYPICRSITGSGALETLRIIQEVIPCEIESVASGAQVFDWTVPLEWNVRDAYVADVRGKRVIDFRANNLHLVNYSAPFRGRVAREELLRHLHSLPEAPELIPYRTTYYQRQWGFCLAHRDLQNLQDDFYDVVVDTSLTSGKLHYGQCVLPGDSRSEVLVSTHICHPSLCNDNLSGICVTAYLARELFRRSRRLTYRFLFIPATIGAIAWLAANTECAARIRAGIVLSCVGDAAPLTYKRSRRGNSITDRAFSLVLSRAGHSERVRDFWPYGYDERQYCSPGFNLPVGCLMRSVYGEFPEYHTSADNLEFVHPGSLRDTLESCLDAFEIVEGNETFRSLNPFGEPQLGKRGLYRSAEENLATLWVLNQSDGSTDLLKVAERAGLPFRGIRQAAERLVANGLLERIDVRSSAEAGNDMPEQLVGEEDHADFPR